MTYKWIGAILILSCCGSVGFSIAAAFRKEENMLQQLISAVTYMESELQYRLTPLPQLCRQTAKYSGGEIRRLFQALAEELEQQILPEASDCMLAALATVPGLPVNLRSLLKELGKSLGQLDLIGQAAGLNHIRDTCKRRLSQLEANRDQRLRSYQTLGLCAGAALAILLV